jgi:hypothetical protein
MVTGSIAYRTLENESPRTVSVIQALLEKHLWCADRCGEMKRVPLNLHRLWDGVITSTDNVGRLRNIATELLSKFSRVGLR